MISSELQRTLVKSPPELWAEISDPGSLARHLGEFGEIRITRVQPEQKVEWETDSASGTVVIKPSGWGTKVKLTVTREFVEPVDEAATPLPDLPQPSAERPVEEPQPSAERPVEEPEPSAERPEREPESAAERTHDSALADEAEPSSYEAATHNAELVRDAELVAGLEQPAEPAQQPEPEPKRRRGFLARLFGRRRTLAAEPSPVSLAAPEPTADAPEPLPRAKALATAEHELDSELAPEQAPDESGRSTAAPTETAEDAAEDDAGDAARDADDASARTKLAEESAAEEVTAVLTGVLDRLGAAHHRPFSRA